MLEAPAPPLYMEPIPDSAWALLEELLPAVDTPLARLERKRREHQRTWRREYMRRYRGSTRTCCRYATAEERTEARRRQCREAMRRKRARSKSPAENCVVTLANTILDAPAKEYERLGASPQTR